LSAILATSDSSIMTLCGQSGLEGFAISDEGLEFVHFEVKSGRL
jgi:hypothetical protein